MLPWRKGIYRWALCHRGRGWTPHTLCTEALELFPDSLHHLLHSAYSLLRASPPPSGNLPEHPHNHKKPILTQTHLVKTAIFPWFVTYGLDRNIRHIHRSEPMRLWVTQKISRNDYTRFANGTKCQECCGMGRANTGEETVMEGC